MHDGHFAICDYIQTPLYHHASALEVSIVSGISAMCGWLFADEMLGKKGIRIHSGSSNGMAWRTSDIGLGISI